MAVEILVLSGSRQGARFQLDRREFRAGSEPDCEIYFNERNDASIRGKLAIFQGRDDGWYIRSPSNQVFVNQQIVGGWTRIRSGDIVRMSPDGPDFSFTIGSCMSSTPVATEAIGAIPLAVVDTVSRTTPVPTEAQQPDAGPVRPSAAIAFAPETSHKRRIWPVIIAAEVIGVAIAVLAWMAMQASNHGPTDQPSTVAAVTSTKSPSPETVATQPPAETSSPAVPIPSTAQDAATAKSEAGVKSPLTTVEQQLENTVYLIEVEKAGHSWPFATCVAIGDDSLLTTAREATQLAKWRAEGQFKIWISQPQKKFREEVQDVRVNGAFAAVAGRPSDWVYYNLGILTTAAKLPEAATLAASDDLAELEEGMPLMCFGFFHDGEAITRFETLEPKAVKARVFIVTRDTNLPGNPRLLHLKTDLPKFAYGSVVVNSKGTVLGLYSESAPSALATNGEAAQNPLKIHYITTAPADLLQPWQQDHNSKMWVVPRTDWKAEKTNAPE